MANEEEIRKLAAENAQIRADWLKGASEIVAGIPDVQKAMQWDVMCEEMIRSAPPGYVLLNTERLQSQLVVENYYLKNNLPKIDIKNTTYATSGSAVAYSVGTEAASLLSGVATNGTTEIKVWATKQLEYFVQPLQEDPFIATISSKIERLYPGLTKEFQDAMQTVRSVLAGINSSAGIAMRNVLENLKGNMLYLARQRSGNQKIREWEEAARVVAKGGGASFESNLLVAKEADWKQMFFDTTGLAKNNSKMKAPDLEAAYFRWLGLVHSILVYIELNDGI